MTLLLLGLLALNLFVSWWNCRVAGAAWDEARQVGGWPRFLAWCAATQSAIGFSGIYLLLLAAIGMVSGLVPPKAATAATHIWYLAVILPALGTGFAILMESWRVAIRDGGFWNTMGASYNTGAMLHNAYQASSGIGDSLGWLGDLLNGDSDDDGGKLFLIGLLLAACALFGGAITTWLLVGRYAREERARRFAGRDLRLA
ncbi:MAG: hypothetical protein E7K72_26370 [Roseomonas mucosa]|nr:hypothetical protein [Roseomonas mucosa]